MPKFCSECGAANTGGRFCSECGTRFADDGGAPPPPPVATAVAAAAPLAKAVAPYATPAAAQGVARSFHHNSTMNNGTFNGGAMSNGTFNGGMMNSVGYNGNTGAGVNSQPLSPPTRKTSMPSAFRNKSVSIPPPPPPPPVVTEPVPPAATGGEAQRCYETCVATIRNSRGGNNEHGVKEFKANCRAYGLKEMEVKPFYDSLVVELGSDGVLSFVPTLARLVPDDDRRKELIDYNAQQRAMAAASAHLHDSNSSSGSSTGRPSAFANRDSSSSQGSYSQRSSSMSGAGGTSKGILKNRYTDHPNCDICNVAFDVTKRRHQCRSCGQFICSSCSPVRLLVPPGKQIEGAKGYDPSIPQRVCIQCAPQLHSMQDELVAQYAQSQNENLHEARGRLHVPFTSSLHKECQNAADILGNFFRDEWGASADRSIPVAILQKAHGLALMTVVKAGFLVSGKIGTGLVVAKLPDGSWSAPSAIGTFGLSGGFEIGGELIEVMIILGSEGAVKVFHKPQVNLGAGLDIAVGPFGRSAEAAAAVSAGGLNANYSYSLSKGFYAGISLQGAIIASRSDLNRKFYGRDLQPSDLLSGFVEQPNAARPLYEAIDRAMQGIDDHKNESLRRSSIMGPCRMCNCPMFVAHTTQVWNKNCKTCKHVH